MLADGAPIVVVGAAGQVGRELQRALEGKGCVLAWDRAAMDLTNVDRVRRALRDLRPAIVINAAAYTAVDLAEQQPDVARHVNAVVPQLLAEEAERAGAMLVHYSTDYVFDGRGTRPYREDDPTGPLGVYGATKLAGDRAILATGARAWIFRVAWVFGGHGKNFLRTIRRLANEREELRIVADQRGTPTWSRAIAEATVRAIELIEARGEHGPQPGVYHMASRGDDTTWFDFATAIVAGERRERTPRVVPIATADYPTPAARPGYSVLDASKLSEEFGIELTPWRSQLADCIAAGIE